MANPGFLILSVLVFACLVTSSNGASPKCECGSEAISRYSFKDGFKFGAAGAAYQLEGAYNLDGKGQNNWDYFTHKYPEKIDDQSNGDVAIDSYHRYKEDVAAVKFMGLDTYRFSFSWARILPKGKVYGDDRDVNFGGIQYYNNLINELIANGIEPYATIFHWDVPQALEKAYGGFRSPRIVKDFAYYADTLFKYFGDRVKAWITLNEPSNFSNGGYATGKNAPGRCSNWQQANCTGGDSATEPYHVTHYQLLAHAEAVSVYRRKYQPIQKGRIGLTLVSLWYVPYSDKPEDKRAKLRALDFTLGWFLEPLTYGHYPKSMRNLVGHRLPRFTHAESKKLIKSFDFLGMNYYTSIYALDAPDPTRPSYIYDSKVNTTHYLDGVPLGDPTGVPWLFIYPKGIRELLFYVKEKYENPEIIITENGVGETNNSTLPFFESLNDTVRLNSINDHLCCLKDAIDEDDVHVTGYIVWSLMDNFEWHAGYTERFGLYYVDFQNGLSRFPKFSALWLKRILGKRAIQPKIADQ